MPAHGNREQQRKAFGNAVIDTLAEFAPNIKDLILHKQVITPWDIEQQVGITQGNISHGELVLDQLFFMQGFLIKIDTLRPMLRQMVPSGVRL
jgi:phytoene dehydrogenase-like protein